MARHSLPRCFLQLVFASSRERHRSIAMHVVLSLLKSLCPAGPIHSLHTHSLHKTNQTQKTYDTTLTMTNLNFDNETNASTLEATRDLQAKSLEALTRIQNQAAETQALGGETLAQLHEQDAKLDSVQQSTKNLQDNLKKTDKLQNRFAFLSMNFGNKKSAKEHVKSDKKTRAILERNEKTAAAAAVSAPTAQPTFKRRGPRPKKNNNADSEGGDGGVGGDLTPRTGPSTPEEAIRQSTKISQEVNAEVERNELFAGRKVDPQEKKKQGQKSKKNCGGDGGINGRGGGGGTQPTPEEKQLTDEDRRQLDAIRADDAAVDAGLDILGNQVDSLLQLSKQMGETVAAHNTKLDTLQTDLSKANDKTHTVNQRAKLFMLNRRQKRKENDNKLGLGNPVSAAALATTFK
jgi:hypothetical protein